jgi:ribosomal protein L11 methyltransferase
VGTGSGVLAIAAWRLGAERVVGIDVDPDALANAGENARLNGAVDSVELFEVDLARAGTYLSERFDLVLANLTGAMLRRFANEFASLLSSTGSVIVSGFQADEQTQVIEALSAAGLAVDRRTNLVVRPKDRRYSVRARAGYQG